MIADLWLKGFVSCMLLWLVAVLADHPVVERLQVPLMLAATGFLLWGVWS